MRKFIISDINGLSDLYYSIMTYLENISQTDEVELYINGNLIGIDNENVLETDLLSDVIQRIESNNMKFKIIYLAGNNEIEFYKTFIGTNKKILFEHVMEFLGNLPIYHRFEETMNDKRIVLAHANSPSVAIGKCNIFVKDIDGDKAISNEITKCVGSNNIKRFSNIGSRDYFSIVGYNPCSSPYGYNYEYNGNYLNIDGGCGIYLKGFTSYNHFPLVEICTNESNETLLNILTFNSNNEIIFGNHFSKKGHIPYTQEELEVAKKLLNSEKQSRI